MKAKSTLTNFFEKLGLRPVFHGCDTIQNFLFIPLLLLYIKTRFGKHKDQDWLSKPQSFIQKITELHMNVKYEKSYIQEKPRIPAEFHNPKNFSCFHVMLCSIQISLSYLIRESSSTFHDGQMLNKSVLENSSIQKKICITCQVLSINQ